MRKLFISFVTAVLLASCNADSLMKETELDLTDTEKVYSDITLTRKVAYDLYARMRMGRDRLGSFGFLVNIGGSPCMLDNATDDGAGNTTRAGGAVIPELEKFIKGGIDASKGLIGGDHPWIFYYKAIRSANTFLNNVDRSPLEDAEKISLKNQVRFLRALYHHELFRFYGALVIGDKELDPLLYDEIKRESLETTVRWIANEFKELAEPGVLPDKYDAADYGRATRGAALGYLARTLLYAASPLHNASGVTWREAADAAYDMIEYADNGDFYRLYEDPTTPEKSYTRLFNTRANGEVIMGFLRAPANDLYGMMPAFDPWNVNKELLTCPNQWLVDCYDMLDGSQPILGYESNTKAIINPNSGYNVNSPYTNRDPRLAQSILCDGATWPLVNGKPAAIDLSKSYRWGSGYFLTKFLDDRIDHRKGGTTYMDFPMMRYAEILLDYAEAENEAEDTNTAREKAIAQLNRIRRRAGITTDLLAADYNQATLRERIRKERRVELCFEDHRFFDIRRWLIAKEVMRLPAVGIKKINGEYQRVTLDTRNYNERMNLAPIPQDEVNNCPNIYQNPGY